MIAPIENFMANLAGLRAERGWSAWWLGRRDHFAFEIVAYQGVISFYVTLPVDLRQFVEQQLQAQYPDAYIEEREDYNIFSPQCIIAGTTLIFKKSFFFPIKTYQEMETDPLNSLTNALSKFREVKHGGAAIQYVVRSAHPRWHAPGNNLAREVRQGKKLQEAVSIVSGSITGSVIRSLLKHTDKKREEKPFAGLSKFDEEAVMRVQQKSAKMGFEVNIRIVVAAET